MTTMLRQADPAAQTVPGPGGTVPEAPSRLPRIAGAVAALAVLAVPLYSSPYWVQTFTATAIYAAVALGVSLLLGRVGMVSLCQFALLAVGAWIALRIGYGLDLPFLLVVLLAGLLTGLVGVLVGLPALRLSGLYLALITLMAAAGVTVVLAATQFPNGGDGVLGFSNTAAGTSQLARPSFATSDGAFYVLTLLIVGALFGLVVWQLRGKAGRAWAAIRQSEATAVAAGVSVVRYKLWAFALAAFITGAAGALLAASGGGVTTYQFPTENNILLLAACLMGGVYGLWGSVVAAVFVKVVPALLQVWGIPSDVLLIAFGVGVIQTVLVSPQGAAAQLGHDLSRLARRLSRGGAR
ncbi:branched-chain amino acid ABC transporter permease [Nocardioides sp. GY 10127]|uniref:branched-chain amino acid ABC transporter permease n=1 Tax=Nocardioides sp. GY 10127 TaxID=2569762 RepID=UPI0010A84E26|nr:branched-chain amino acid ABC transporter permease [Nocardioides sp. GY 10127]TIC79994.1 branched-chain amino acid ABC transporter permease [Nocardioides sp. GY 10127]